MPKIHVAYRTDANGAGHRCADGSFIKLKQRIREFPMSEWTVAHYNLKPDVKTFCDIFENPTQVEYEALERVRITEGGRIKAVEENAA